MNNYNPGYYTNYSPYSQYAQPQMQQPQMPQSQFQQQPQMQMQIPQQQPIQQFPVSGLNGKIVDSADIVRATEVPLGSYGIFPKADMSEIYIKTWNSNGTTSIITFKPTVPEELPPVRENNDIGQVLQKIETLELKLDALIEERAMEKAGKKEMLGNGF